MARAERWEPVRWGRLNDVWVLHGRDLVEGSMVMVRSATAGIQNVTVGPFIRRDDRGGVYHLPVTRIERPAGDPPPEPGRLYRRRLDGKVVKAVRSVDGSHTYGLYQAADGHWLYAAGAFNGGVAELSEVEAAEIGQRTGRCPCCDKPLSNPQTRAAGIGARCQQRWYGTG